MKKRFTTLLLTLFIVGGMAYAGDIDVTGHITSDVTWTADNDYYLDGFVFVDDGATVTVEPGTVIRGYEGQGADASALIVMRGGKLIANGTADKPIIFTTETDNDLTMDETTKGAWGGVILLGKALTNNLGYSNGIEGVPLEDSAFYGGNDDADNSGSLKFVSIRHGGSELAPDEEINGLTAGAVGSATTFEHIEIFANSDDGIEFFGGSVNLKYFLVSDCADDGFDIDEGYHGKFQFVEVVQQGDGTGDNLGEHDGGPSSNRWGTPYATPVISNATYIGGGASAGDRTLTLRDFWQGEYHNSIFAEQAKGIRLDYIPLYDGGAKGGSFTAWNNGILKIEDNIFQHVADGTPANIFTVYSEIDSTVPPDSATKFANYFAAAGNTVDDALGISTANPVPANASDVADPDFTGMDSFFEQVSYKGAFDPSVTCGNWAGSWTYTYASTDYAASSNDCSGSAVKSAKFDAKAKVYPNPAADIANITFDNAEGEAFILNVYSVNGEIVKTLSTSASAITLNISDLSSGLYTFTLRNADASINSVGQLIVK